MAANESESEMVVVFKPTSEESELAIKSAKMHLRILQAQIAFLEETKSITPELQGMISSLLPSAKQPSGPAAPPEQAASTPTNKPKPEPEIFTTPQHYSAKCNYLGGNFLDVVAKTGDEIIVCGTHGDFALAYNPRNKTAGRIPFSYLQKVKSETVANGWVYLANNTRHVSVDNTTQAYILCWSKGDHIRVYQWESAYKTSGIGVNLATNQIGRFTFNGHSIWQLIEDNV